MLTNCEFCGYEKDKFISLISEKDDFEYFYCGEKCLFKDLENKTGLRVKEQS